MVSCFSHGVEVDDIWAIPIALVPDPETVLASIPLDMADEMAKPLMPPPEPREIRSKHLVYVVRLLPATEEN